MIYQLPRKHDTIQQGDTETLYKQFKEGLIQDIDNIDYLLNTSIISESEHTQAMDKYYSV